jgi:hypothetical protein
MLLANAQSERYKSYIYWAYILLLLKALYVILQMNITSSLFQIFVTLSAAAFIYVLRFIDLWSAKNASQNSWAKSIQSIRWLNYTLISLVCIGFVYFIHKEELLFAFASMLIIYFLECLDEWSDYNIENSAIARLLQDTIVYCSTIKWMKCISHFIIGLRYFNCFNIAIDELKTNFIETIDVFNNNTKETLPAIIGLFFQLVQALVKSISFFFIEVTTNIIQQLPQVFQAIAQGASIMTLPILFIGGISAGAYIIYSLFRVYVNVGVAIMTVFFKDKLNTIASIPACKIIALPLIEAWNSLCWVIDAASKVPFLKDVVPNWMRFQKIEYDENFNFWARVEEYIKLQCKKYLAEQIKALSNEINNKFADIKSLFSIVNYNRKIDPAEITDKLNRMRSYIDMSSGLSPLKQSLDKYINATNLYCQQNYGEKYNAGIDTDNEILKILNDLFEEFYVGSSTAQLKTGVQYMIVKPTLDILGQDWLYYNNEDIRQSAINSAKRADIKARAAQNISNTLDRPSFVALEQIAREIYKTFAPNAPRIAENIEKTMFGASNTKIDINNLDKIANDRAALSIKLATDIFNIAKYQVHINLLNNDTLIPSLENIVPFNLENCIRNDNKKYNTHSSLILLAEYHRKILYNSKENTGIKEEIMSRKPTKRDYSRLRNALDAYCSRLSYMDFDNEENSIVSNLPRYKDSYLYLEAQLQAADEILQYPVESQMLSIANEQLNIINIPYLNKSVDDKLPMTFTSKDRYHLKHMLGVEYNQSNNSNIYKLTPCKNPIVKIKQQAYRVQNIDILDDMPVSAGFFGIKQYKNVFQLKKADVKDIKIDLCDYILPDFNIKQKLLNELTLRKEIVPNLTSVKTKDKSEDINVVRIQRNIQSIMSVLNNKQCSFSIVDFDALNIEEHEQAEFVVQNTIRHLNKIWENNKDRLGIDNVNLNYQITMLNELLPENTQSPLRASDYIELANQINKIQYQLKLYEAILSQKIPCMKDSYKVITEYCIKVVGSINESAIVNGQKGDKAEKKLTEISLARLANQHHKGFDYADNKSLGLMLLNSVIKIDPANAEKAQIALLVYLPLLSRLGTYQQIEWNWNGKTKTGRTIVARARNMGLANDRFPVSIDLEGNEGVADGITMYSNKYYNSISLKNRNDMLWNGIRVSSLYIIYDIFKAFHSLQNQFEHLIGHVSESIRAIKADGPYPIEYINSINLSNSAVNYLQSELQALQSSLNDIDASLDQREDSIDSIIYQMKYNIIQTTYDLLSALIGKDDVEINQDYFAWINETMRNNLLDLITELPANSVATATGSISAIANSALATAINHMDNNTHKSFYDQSWRPLMTIYYKHKAIFDFIVGGVRVNDFNELRRALILNPATCPAYRRADDKQLIKFVSNRGNAETNEEKKLQTALLIYLPLLRKYGAQIEWNWSGATKTGRRIIVRARNMHWDKTKEELTVSIDLEGIEGVANGIPMYFSKYFDDFILFHGINAQSRNRMIWNARVSYLNILYYNIFNHFKNTQYKIKGYVDKFKLDQINLYSPQYYKYFSDIYSTNPIEASIKIANYLEQELDSVIADIDKYKKANKIHYTKSRDWKLYPAGTVSERKNDDAIGDYLINNFKGMVESTRKLLVYFKNDVSVDNSNLPYLTKLTMNLYYTNVNRAILNDDNESTNVGLDSSGETDLIKEFFRIHISREQWWGGRGYSAADYKRCVETESKSLYTEVWLKLTHCFYRHKAIFNFIAGGAVVNSNEEMLKALQKNPLVYSNVIKSQNKKDNPLQNKKNIIPSLSIASTFLYITKEDKVRYAPYFTYTRENVEKYGICGLLDAIGNGHIWQYACPWIPGQNEVRKDVQFEAKTQEEIKTLEVNNTLSYIDKNGLRVGMINSTQAYKEATKVQPQLTYKEAKLNKRDKSPIEVKKLFDDIMPKWNGKFNNTHLLAWSFGTANISKFKNDSRSSDIITIDTPAALKKRLQDSLALLDQVTKQSVDNEDVPSYIISNAAYVFISEFDKLYTQLIAVKDKETFIKLGAQCIVYINNAIHIMIAEEQSQIKIEPTTQKFDIKTYIDKLTNIDNLTGPNATETVQVWKVESYTKYIKEYNKTILEKIQALNAATQLSNNKEFGISTIVYNQVYVALKHCADIVSQLDAMYKVYTTKSKLYTEDDTLLNDLNKVYEEMMSKKSSNNNNEPFVNGIYVGAKQILDKIRRIDQYTIGKMLDSKSIEDQINIYVAYGFVYNDMRDPAAKTNAIQKICEIVKKENQFLLMTGAQAFETRYLNALIYLDSNAFQILQTIFSKTCDELDYVTQIVIGHDSNKGEISLVKSNSFAEMCNQYSKVFKLSKFDDLYETLPNSSDYRYPLSARISSSLDTIRKLKDLVEALNISFIGNTSLVMKDELQRVIDDLQILKNINFDPHQVQNMQRIEDIYSLLYKLDDQQNYQERSNEDLVAMHMSDQLFLYYQLNIPAFNLCTVVDDANIKYIAENSHYDKTLLYESAKTSINRSMYKYIATYMDSETQNPEIERNYYNLCKECRYKYYNGTFTCSSGVYVDQYNQPHFSLLDLGCIGLHIDSICRDGDVVYS